MLIAAVKVIARILDSPQRDLFAIAPPGHDLGTLTPDPYLVATPLRPDAILLRHAALDLPGVSRSLCRCLTYFTPMSGARFY